MIRLLAAAVLIALSPVAHADVSPNDISIANFNPAQAVAPISTVQGPGVKIGEGTVLRPVFGVETGFVSNVFYTDTNPQASGVLRLLAQVGTASFGIDRLSSNATPDSDQPTNVNRGSLEYSANLRASYDIMLTTNDTVQDTGGLGLGLTLHGLTNPGGRFSVGVDDEFVRLIRAANFETDANTNRDINNFTLSLHYQPPDRSISGYFYFSNTLDLFERAEQRFANRMTNRFGLHPTWQWLPKTQVYGDFSWGIQNSINDSAIKSNSYPLTTLLGISTLITAKTIANLNAGYTNGFYSSGPSFSAPTVNASVTLQHSPLGRATFGYSLLYTDSINANYYRDHVLYLTAQQLFSPVVLMVQPEFHARKYAGVNMAVPDIAGPDTRNDLIFAVVAGLNYNFRNWFSVGLNYRFSTVQTDYRYLIPGNPMPTDPSYIRHEMLLGARAAL